jgi:ABC transport system ATP-binding/permease protein
VFEADNRIEQYPGGYSHWLERGRKLAETDNPNRGRAKQAAPAAGATPARAESTAAPKPASTKLSFKLKHELDKLPARIDALEQEIAALTADTSASGFYQRPHTDTQAVLAALSAKQIELDGLITRWAELETLQQSS